MSKASAARRHTAPPRRRAGPPRTADLRIIPIPIVGEVKPGDSLTGLLQQALKHQNKRLRKGDILVIKHKIVSKVEGQLVDLNTIKASAASRRWAGRYDLDPRVIELAIAQSRRIVRRKRGVLDHGNPPRPDLRQQRGRRFQR